MIVVIVAGLLALAALVGLPAYQPYRATAELRGDWWPRFEAQLREYMSQAWRSARESEHGF
jgi:hypothetical protein